MFSGIITDIAEVLSQQNRPDGLKLTFKRPSQWNDLSLGESIATDGVCLTIDEISDDSYGSTLIPQTLQVTTFGRNIPAQVNLERSLKIGDRISGHFVQGHVDDIGTVAKINEADEYKIWIDYSPEKRALIVDKGSIVVNGVALTVAEIKDSQFCVALVPFTLAHTTLGVLAQGDLVNLEYDVLGKYVVNAVDRTSTKQHISGENLRSDTSASHLPSLLGKQMPAFVYLRGCVHHVPKSTLRFSAPPVFPTGRTGRFSSQTAPFCGTPIGSIKL